MNALIIGKTAEGKVVYYTGKAGDGWISDKMKDAFIGYSLEGARNKAKNFNQMTAVHGIHWIGFDPTQVEA